MPRAILTKAAAATGVSYLRKILSPEQAQLKVLDATIDAPGGQLEGYASVFGNVDLGKDVVVKGAFKKTIKERLGIGAIKFVDSHLVFTYSSGTKSIVGVVTDAKEDDFGLWFRAKLSTVQDAQDIRTKVKEGILTALSFGYDIIKAEADPSDASVQLLKELKLHEISVVAWGMNEMAHLTGVKAAVDVADPAAEKAAEDAKKEADRIAAEAKASEEAAELLLTDIQSYSAKAGLKEGPVMPPSYTIAANDAPKRCATCAAFDNCCDNEVNGGCDYFNVFVMHNGICAAFNYLTGDPDEPVEDMPDAA